jgi:hypothetical protein
MANIDPVRLLKASPAENLSNLNSIDQAESHADQLLTSFPDELQAAKQGNRDDNAALDKDRQNALDAQQDLQNLPVNAAVTPNQPANIADKPKQSADAPVNQLSPGGATLTQLEVAQTIAVDDGLISQAATPMIVTAVQGADILVSGQADAEKQSIESLAAANAPVAAMIDPATAAASALAATQASVATAPQNIVAPVLAEGATNTTASIGAISSVSASSAQTTINQVGEAPALDATASIPTQNISQDLINTAVNLDQDAAAINVAQTNTDALTESSAGVLNAMNTVASDEATNTQVIAGANVVGAQPTDQNEATNVVTTGAAAPTAQAETPLVSANTLAAEPPVANPTKATEASQLAAASIQDADVSEQNLNLARPAQANATTQGVQSNLIATNQTALASDAVKASASAVADAQDLANLTQTPSTNSLRVEARNESAANADAAVQSLRIDNARMAGLSNEKSTVVAELAANEVAQPEVKDLSQVSTGSSSGGLADMGSRTITSPFSQELRLAQSSQTLKLEPQQASLITGPLHVEVMRVLKEGGGRVIMEVTPPDQGAIQLDLRLDGNGKAYLIVEGASDSTKARLEQGGSQLKEQLEQMGLSLSLDMRDRSGEPDHIPFAMSQNFSATENGVDSQLGELMPVGRSGISPNGRVSIYA